MSDPENPTPLDAELARRLYDALTAGRDGILPLLNDPSMEVLRSLLKNPRLDESLLLMLLKRRDLAEDILAAVSRLSLAGESHPVKVALVHHPVTPGRIVQTLLPHLYLFELVTVCFLPGVTPDQKVAAERAIIQRLPVTPLGNKITLARRATSDVVDVLLQEGNPHLMDACLDNPRIRESAMFRFLNGPTASAETISSIARHPRWKSRPNLKLAILKNGRTPHIWFTVFLPTLPLVEVKNLRVSGRLGAAQKQCVEEELKRRGMR
jgi:hypothetical protein